MEVTLTDTWLGVDWLAGELGVVVTEGVFSEWLSRPHWSHGLRDIASALL